MDKPTCIWPEGCDSPRHGCGLCKRHWQRAKRSGTLDTFRAQAQASLACAWCGDVVAGRARGGVRYCSKRCYNAAYKVRGAARTSLEKQREYARKSYRKRRAATLAAIGARLCAECGDTLPASAPLRRAYCSRSCINKASLREKAAQRLEANRLRRARIKAANSPGVSERDWRRMLIRYDNRCAYCASADQITMDHVVPIARGGWHAIGNVVPACFACNSSKRDDLLVYWRNGRAKARLARAS